MSTKKDFSIRSVKDKQDAFEVSAQKSGVGAASAAWEPCALRLKAHLQKLIPGLRKAILPNY